MGGVNCDDDSDLSGDYLYGGAGNDDSTARRAAT